MKNPMLYYGIIALGIIALVVGGVLLAGMAGTHHTLPFIALGIGVVLLIAGVAGWFVMKPKVA